MTDFKPGLMSGLIAGAVWGAIITAIGVLSAEVSFSQEAIYYRGLLAGPNSTSLGCTTPTECINNAIEVGAITTLTAALLFGALIGFIFVLVIPRFLGNRSYMLKGVVLSVFFWLLYELGLAAFTNVIEIASSLAISLFAGYLMGYLYLRFVGPPHPIPSDEAHDSLQNPKR
jgi:hypothetical protein